MNRRHFLSQTSAACAVPFIASGAQADSPPPKVIYSNDTTHILSCLRPENRQDFTDALLQKSITEAAGADAHFLQPGLGWIPWWKSEIYSVEDHYKWLQDTHGIKGIRKIDRYMMDGGDMLRTLVDTCKSIDVAPYLSFRLNDGHHVRDLAEALERGKPTQNMARHYWENYEKFRIGPDTVEWDDGVFDWSIPEVRDYKFSLIEEACANYDISGLELDFLRHWVRFGKNTEAEERFSITTDFVRRVRKMLDETAEKRNLPYRRLCVRVPAVAEEVRPDQGIDLQALTAAGADMINLSYSYFTWQDNSAAVAREQAGPDASIYIEMTHTTMTGRATAGSGTQPYLRTTEQQFLTTAKLAREQGATGVSLFNFPYYRYHVTDTIGPFHEPPFSVISKLKDEAEPEGQWYFLSSGRKDRVLGTRVLPVILKRSHSQTFEIGMLPQKSDSKPGLLRIRSDEPIADREVEILFNEIPLARVEPVIKPLPHPYDDTWNGKPEELLCYTFPPDLPVQKKNQITITVRKGIRVRLTYLDITIPT